MASWSGGGSERRLSACGPLVRADFTKIGVVVQQDATRLGVLEVTSSKFRRNGQAPGGMHAGQRTKERRGCRHVCPLATSLSITTTNERSPIDLV